MRTLQHLLNRFGWPVDRLSFKQIASELYRRWFHSPPEDADAGDFLSAASAAGIVVALACEENFSALRWPDARPNAQATPVLAEEEKHLFRKPRQEVTPPMERRSAQRKPGREIVFWSGTERGGDGFLVDYSEGGIAFITERERSPQIGVEISAAIRNRFGKTEDLGTAMVVRTEVLTPDLSLTCLRLHQPQPELMQP